ncbi:hypothetical protein [Bdellovibrio sp. HCB337]|uniref:hypothetical protein n=1 Tax=Bdellovibrio sp. HCB337 TaxID=3394358 RepID=UPI0039A4B7E0
MKKLILVMLLTPAMAWTSATSSCDNAKEDLRHLNLAIFGDKSSNIDMSPKIHEAKALVNRCQMNLRTLGLTDAIYDQALEKNRREEIVRQEFILDLYSTSGKVDERLAAYKKYLTEGNDSRPAVRTEKFLKKVKKQAAQSYAEESKTCTNIDLRDKSGPVFNQGTDGWCYAFTVANMVSYRIDQQVSAAGVAFAYADNEFYDLFRMVGVTQDLITNIGFTTFSFRAAKAKGFCLEKDLPSEGFKGIYTNVPLAALDRLGKKALRSEIAREEFITKARALFPNLSKEQFIETLKKSNRATYLTSLVNKNCSNRIRTDDLEMTFFTKTNTKKFGHKIDELLSKKTPVEIGYNADFFVDAYSPTGTAYHSSLLVGRRMNTKTGQCEYLLKNSYGKEWRPESPEFEADGGHAWIPKSRMIEATRNASYIK